MKRRRNKNWTNSRLIKSRITEGDMERFWDNLDSALLKRISIIKNR